MRSPVLQKVIIEANDDGSPDTKVKLGFDLAKLLYKSSKSKTSSKSRKTRAQSSRSFSKADRSPKNDLPFGQVVFVMCEEENRTGTERSERNIPVVAAYLLLFAFNFTHIYDEAILEEKTAA